jgi:thiamine biosynthesis protein ThiI
MQKNIIIRYGELFLKGANRHYFQSLLQKNIEKALESFDCLIVKTQSRIYIEEYNAKEEDKIVDALKCVFGIHSMSKAVKVPTDMEALKQACLNDFPAQGKFRVSVNRADPKVTARSTDIAAQIGAFMLSKNERLKVDLFDFDFEVKVDIRENGYSYIYKEDIPAAGGLPVGCSGKGMLLLSGGIDSPVAGMLMAKRGMSIQAVHFHSFPYTSELAKQKVLDLAKIISRYTLPVKVHIIPFTEIQQAIHQYCPAEYMITEQAR